MTENQKHTLSGGHYSIQKKSAREQLPQNNHKYG